MAKEHEVATELDIVFAEHDGVKLFGDLYLPKGLGMAPVLVGVPGPRSPSLSRNTFEPAPVG